ncbi:MAG: hypothetical protein AAGJ40_00295 [Planctomycetota bacterium]
MSGNSGLIPLSSTTDLCGEELAVKLLDSQQVRLDGFDAALPTGCPPISTLCLEGSVYDLASAKTHLLVFFSFDQRLEPARAEKGRS